MYTTGVRLYTVVYGVCVMYTKGIRYIYGDNLWYTICIRCIRYVYDIYVICIRYVYGIYVVCIRYVYDACTNVYGCIR